MKVADEIRFPRLGWSMEEGKFIQWLKKDGELVREGEPLFEMEGEKALQEIEAVGNGILKIATDAPSPDEVVPVGRLLGYLLLPNEILANETAGPEIKTPPSATSTPTTITSHEISSDDRLGIDKNAIPMDGLDRKADTGKTIASPRARRLAEAHEIDWRKISGTGRDGRVRETDVQTVIDDQHNEETHYPNSRTNLFTPRRKMIAERLRASRALTVPVTLHTKVDVSSLVAYRDLQKKMHVKRVPAFTDLFAKHVALVLARHPAMAVRWNHDHTELYEIPNSEFHIGIAVDTVDGLLVPVVRSVYSQSIDDIVLQSHALIEKARAGRLSKLEMSDGVISITNLGTYGIDEFTPVINIPEISILGLGAIRRETTNNQADQLITRPMMVLSLTFDHAAIDGAPAAAFLKDLVTEIESVIHF